MHVGDTITKKVNKSISGSFLVVLDRDWLQFCGFTEKELANGEIDIVFKAEVSEHKKIPYIGFGKPKRD